jgi:copper resistance protein D
MIDICLVLSRFLHFAATTTLFGAALFPLYGNVDAEPKRAARWRSKLLLLATILALVSGLFWFVFSAAGMTGSLSDLADGEALWAIVHDTGFGVIWTVRMVLATIMLIVLLTLRPLAVTVRQNVAVSILAAMLLASLAGVGHTQVEEGWASLVHVSSDAVHLLAAGAWLGGLAALAHVLVHYADKSSGSASVDRILLRFSGMGYMAVATLIGTGLVNSWFLIGAVSNLPTTPYGQLLLAKLALFAGMLALAVANRFWLVPSIGGVRSGREPETPLRKLHNHVLGEQVLGAMVLAIVSLLGTMPPAVVQ